MRKNRFLVFKVMILVVSFLTLFCSFAENSLAESAVTGVWKLNANSYKGIMQIRNNSGEYHGQLKLESDGKWEDLLDLRINGSAISFRRATSNQKYSGTINGDHIRGKFNQDGAGSYNWSAVKSAGGGEDTRGVLFDGNYTINANNFRGIMEIRENAGAYTGRMKLQGNWDEMLDLNINGNGISFRRAHANQRYKGSFKGGIISGAFNQDGKGSFQWRAEKK